MITGSESFVFGFGSGVDGLDCRAVDGKAKGIPRGCKADCEAIRNRIVEEFAGESLRKMKVVLDRMCPEPEAGLRLAHLFGNELASGEQTKHE